MLYGVIDIGSNSVRLVVYKSNENRFDLLFSKKAMVGLASYVNKQGFLSDDGIEILIDSLNDFKVILSEMNLDDVFVFATASLRNICNTGDVVDIVHKRTGFEVDVLSGEMEGVYDFEGAMFSGKLDSGVLVDVGGGSTEIVCFKDGCVVSSVSLEIGSLNLFKRFVKDIVPSGKECEKIRDYVCNALDMIEFSNVFYDDVFIVGGTARAVLKLCEVCLNNNSSLFSEFSYEDLRSIFNLYVFKRKKFVQYILKCCPDRIHTILPGLFIFDEIARRCNAKKFVVSRYGVREGYLLEKACIGKVDDSYEE